MGGSALANAEAMTCLRGAGSWARPCGVIELTCAALRWPAADAGRWAASWPSSLWMNGAPIRATPTLLPICRAKLTEEVAAPRSRRGAVLLVACRSGADRAGALVLAASRPVESSIGSVIRTSPVSGRHPRTARPATRAANDECECAGSTRQWPAASRGCLPGCELDVGRRGHGHLLRSPGQPADDGCRARCPAWVPGRLRRSRSYPVTPRSPGAAPAMRPRPLPSAWKAVPGRRARSPRRWRASRRSRTVRQVPRTAPG